MLSSFTQSNQTELLRKIALSRGMTPSAANAFAVSVSKANALKIQGVSVAVPGRTSFAAFGAAASFGSVNSILLILRSLGKEGVKKLIEELGETLRAIVRALEKLLMNADDNKTKLKIKSVESQGERFRQLAESYKLAIEKGDTENASRFAGELCRISSDGFNGVIISLIGAG